MAAQPTIVRRSVDVDIPGAPAPSATRRRWAPPQGFADVARQLGIVALGYFAYAIVRGLAEGHADAAFSHARDLISLERSLHIFVEPSMQHWASGSHLLMSVASWIYVNAQSSVCIGALVYLYFFHNRSFYFVRNMFAISMMIALIVYWAFPVAPPRFLPEWGFTDSVANFTGVHVSTGLGGAHVTINPSSAINLYAAVPSMHVAYALMLGWPLARLSRWRPVRLAWYLYPLLITFVTIITANHFILDAVLGALTALAAAYGARWLARWRPASWRFRYRPVGVGAAG